MIPEFFIQPCILLLGQWVYPTDLIISTNRRIIRIKTRQIQISKNKSDKYKFIMRQRRMEAISIPIGKNLWRTKDAYGDWAETKKLTFIEGFNKFDSQGIEFIAEVEKINDNQVKFWMGINESRNAAATEIGYDFHQASITEDGNNPEAGIADPDSKK